MKTIVAGLLIGISLLGCSKHETTSSSVAPPETGRSISTFSTATVSNSNLITYKQSQHQLMCGYWRTWYDNAQGSSNIPKMTDVPDSLDIVDVFPDYTPNNNPFWNTLKNTYVPALHAKGTKVVIASGLGDWATGISSGIYTHDITGYQKYAKMVMDSAVNKYGLDGFDMDIESSPSGQTLTDYTGISKALSAYLGPKSGTGKILIYDTNQDGTTALFGNISTYISYVFLQAYGRDVSSLTGTFNTYSNRIAAAQFLVGFSFNEGSTIQWNDVPFNNNGNTGRCYDYARWNGTNKGGVFGYAIDRDRQDPNNANADYFTTKHIIGIMNPAQASQLIANGTYNIVVNSSQLYAEVPNSNINNDVQLDQWGYNGGYANQQFIITALGNNVYKLVNKNSGKALEAKGGGTAAGTAVSQYTDNGTASQQWKITTSSVSGYYYITNANNNLNMEVSGGGNNQGTLIDCWTPNGNSNQQWKIK